MVAHRSYFVFDLLQVDGEDLLTLTMEVRKIELRACSAPRRPRLNILLATAARPTDESLPRVLDLAICGTLRSTTFRRRSRHTANSDPVASHLPHDEQVPVHFP